MIDQLRVLLTGKRVRMTHTNPHLTPYEGVCKGIRHFNGGKEKDHFIIELSDERCVGFVAEKITSTFVDGPLRTQAGGRRRIDIV